MSNNTESLMTNQLEAQFYFGAVIDHDGECQRVSDEEAQFWTVYERNADGLSSAICDCTHRDDAVAATERFNALIAALEQSQGDAKSRGITACELFDEVTLLRTRITELQPDCRNALLPALDGLDEAGLRSVVQATIDKYASLHVQFTEKVNRIAELEVSQLAVKLPPHKYSECVNGLLEEAIAYAGTQQLRARLASRLSNFVKPDLATGITVQGDE